MSARDELERVKWDNVAQHRFAERLLDAIEAALKEHCHEECPSTPCESCRMAAILKGALKGSKCALVLRSNLG